MIKFSKDSTWMPCPNTNIKYPGLAYLCPLDELTIVQQRDNLHDVIGVKGAKTYTIYNKLGEKVFIAVERSKFRNIHLMVYNHYGNEVIQIVKPCKVLKLCKSEISIWAPPGNFVGQVKKSCSNIFDAKNWYGDGVFTIKPEQNNCKHEWNIIYCDEDIIGKVMNDWVATTTCRNFGVSFANDLLFLDKAMLVGACFLISWVNFRNCC